MPGLQKIEHVRFQVEDIETALEFYVDSMELNVIQRDDAVAYLGCGLDDNFDVAVVDGGTGVDHAAIRVDSLGELEEYQSRLGAAGVGTERTDGEEPAQAYGLRFSVPSGLALELVVVDSDVQYHHSSQPAIETRRSVAPLDLDHFNYLSPLIEEDVAFLRDYVDFELTEVLGPEKSPRGAFLRRGDYHHDIGVLVTEETPETHASMHHVAWKLSGIEHMKTLIDQLASDGITLESGPSRHLAGNNIFSYFWEPGGNRFELCTEMATLSKSTTSYVEMENTFSVWDSYPPPESWARGSGLAGGQVTEFQD